MTDTEKMILSDAIRSAILAEKQRIKWRRISLILALVIVGLIILLIGG